MNHKISDIIKEFRQDESSINNNNNSNDNIYDFTKNDKLIISIEYFPPKTDTGIAVLYNVTDKLKASYPISFVDVTWGAGETLDFIIKILFKLILLSSSLSSSPLPSSSSHHSSSFLPSLPTFSS